MAQEPEESSPPGSPPSPPPPPPPAMLVEPPSPSDELMHSREPVGQARGRSWAIFTAVGLGIANEEDGSIVYPIGKLRRPRLAPSELSVSVLVDGRELMLECGTKIEAQAWIKALEVVSKQNVSQILSTDRTSNDNVLPREQIGGRSWAVLTSDGLGISNSDGAKASTITFPLKKLLKPKFLKTGNGISVQVDGRELQMQCRTADEASRWIDAIQAAQEGGSTTPAQSLSQVPSSVAKAKTSNTTAKAKATDVVAKAKMGLATEPTMATTPSATSDRGAADDEAVEVREASNSPDDGPQVDQGLQDSKAIRKKKIINDRAKAAANAEAAADAKAAAEAKDTRLKSDPDIKAATEVKAAAEAKVDNTKAGKDRASSSADPEVKRAVAEAKAAADPEVKRAVAEAKVIAEAKAAADPEVKRAVAEAKAAANAKSKAKADKAAANQKTQDEAMQEVRNEMAMKRKSDVGKASSTQDMKQDVAAKTAISPVEKSQNMNNNVAATAARSPAKTMSDRADSMMNDGLKANKKAEEDSKRMKQSLEDRANALVDKSQDRSSKSKIDVERQAKSSMPEEDTTNDRGNKTRVPVRNNTTRAEAVVVAEESNNASSKLLTKNEEKRAVRVFDRMDSRNTGKVDPDELASIAKYSDRAGIFETGSATEAGGINKQDWQKFLCAKKNLVGEEAFGTFLGYIERTSAHFSDTFQDELRLSTSKPIRNATTRT